MAKKRRRYDREFKLSVMAELAAGKTLGEIAREHGIDPSLPSRWRKELARYSEAAFAGQGNLYKDEARIAQLEMELSQLHAEKILLQRALALKKKRMMPEEMGESQTARDGNESKALW
jgi:transposase